MVGHTFMKLFGRKNSPQTTTFRRKRFPFFFTTLAVLSFAALGLIIYAFPPTANYTLVAFPLSILLLFFPLVFSFFFFATSAIFRSKWHGSLVASFVTLYLLFRINNLTHPFFLILLAALFVTLELMVANRRD